MCWLTLQISPQDLLYSGVFSNFILIDWVDYAAGFHCPSRSVSLLQVKWSAWFPWLSQAFRSCLPCGLYSVDTYITLCLLVSMLYCKFFQLLINNSQSFGEFDLWHGTTDLITSLFTLMVFQGVLTDQIATRLCTFQFVYIKWIYRTLWPPRQVINMATLVSPYFMMIK